MQIEVAFCRLKRRTTNPAATEMVSAGYTRRSDPVRAVELMVALDNWSEEWRSISHGI